MRISTSYMIYWHASQGYIIAVSNGSKERASLVVGLAILVLGDRGVEQAGALDLVLGKAALRPRLSCAVASLAKMKAATEHYLTALISFLQRQPEPTHAEHLIRHDMEVRLVRDHHVLSQ